MKVQPISWLVLLDLLLLVLAIFMLDYLLVDGKTFKVLVMLLLELLALGQQKHLEG
jgi:hypothetical protein